MPDVKRIWFYKMADAGVYKISKDARRSNQVGRLHVERTPSKIAWPMSVRGSGRLCWVTTNTTLFPGTRRSCASSNFACVGYGRVFWSAVVSAQRCVGNALPQSLTGGFLHPAFCIPTPTLASTPRILRKSRMRRRARADLCGGRPAMVVPTATVIHLDEKRPFRSLA